MLNRLSAGNSPVLAMATKPTTQNSRLLKRTTVRDEKSKSDGKVIENCDSDATSHEAVIKCEVSTLSRRKLEPMSSPVAVCWLLNIRGL